MRTTRMELAAVALGGFIGAVARAELDTLIKPAPSHWPWSTLIVNVVGAFALGYSAALARSHHHRAFVEVGICGTLTTFSALQLELLQMLDANCLGLAAGYAAASIALGYTAVLLAQRIAGATR